MEAGGGKSKAKRHAPHGPEQNSTTANTIDDEDGEDGEDPVDDCNDGAYRDGVAEANDVEEGGRVVHQRVETIQTCQ